jgi:hypothetical protein
MDVYTRVGWMRKKKTTRGKHGKGREKVEKRFRNNKKSK